MGIKATLSIPFAKYIVSQIKRSAARPLQEQQKIFHQLISKGKKTLFGSDHNFDKIQNYIDFKKNVPVRDYEMLKPYIEKIKSGSKNILWENKPLYWAKTSGTTSGIKYIPITKDSMPHHINAARNALLMYIVNKKDGSFMDGKMIFLSGSPALENRDGVLTGRLSGIVNHHVPIYIKSNWLPSYTTNCIEDWEQKLDAIIGETLHQNMAVISGIPPWVYMYFEKLFKKTGKKIKDIFPCFSLFIHGGVNFIPYKSNFEKIIGDKIDYLETYPASEGFIAYQDTLNEQGLMLIVNGGIFYEFIPADEFFKENPTRIPLIDVELNVNYVIILNTNAGLWGYNIGDTVKFVSLKPYRLVVTGRIKHFISAHGEHVIVEEVEDAMQKTANEFNAEIIEYTVAPRLKIEKENAYHEWFVEFGKLPQNLDLYEEKVDLAMQKKNIYYRDLRKGNMLLRLKIRVLKKDAFRNYMKSKGKLGGQNKVPRLSNDRVIVDELQSYIE